MLDGSAFPQPQSQLPDRARAGRLRFSPRALQALLVVIGIALATFVLYLYVLPNSQIDAARVHIADLKLQKATLERQNAALLQEIALASNMKTLEIRARALGMGPVRSTIYLQLPTNDAAPAADPAARAGHPEAEDAPATLAEWLARDHLQEKLRQVRQNVSAAVDTVIQRFGAQP